MNKGCIFDVSIRGNRYRNDNKIEPSQIINIHKVNKENENGNKQGNRTI